MLEMAFRDPSNDTLNSGKASISNVSKKFQNKREEAVKL